MAVLRVEGLVRKVCEFSLDDLAALSGQVPDVTTLVPGREGSAVRLAALVAAVGVASEATHLTLESTESLFAASAPLADVAEGLVLYRLGAVSLPETLGGPYRFLIPAVTGSSSAPVDPCGNVKFLKVLRFEAGMGRDTRPPTRQAHTELHAAEGHPEHPSVPRRG